jgi:hypothetical protein
VLHAVAVVALALVVPDGGKWALGLLPYLILLGWPLLHVFRSSRTDGPVADRPAYERRGTAARRPRFP